MEVRRQILICLIVCCCANYICTEDLADRNHESTTLPSEESSNLTKLETGNLSGKITANKNGVKLELNIEGEVFWTDNKSMDNNTCKGAVKQKGEKGDKGNDGLPGPVGLKGEKGEKGPDALQGAKGEKGLKGAKGDSGPRGQDGNKGKKGSNGLNGEKGKKGKTGKCSDTTDITKTHDYGKQTNPAYSCDVLKSNGIYYLNPENGFQMLCQNKKACVRELSRNSFTKLGIRKSIWISKLLNLKNLYTLKISQLSYLMTSNEGFHLSLLYSKEVKILEILSWNGIIMTDIDKENNIKNGCKVAIENKETQTQLDITCKPANYLPMDFRIEPETENVSIELLSLCFI